MPQIISYYLFLQLCSFLLIPSLCHGQGEEGDGTARPVVELSFERLRKHILRTYVGQHIRRSERWTS